MKTIEREFHLHDGQEREIIMKLWLKGQAMISILQRFRHLLQDLNIDDKDFVEGIKVRRVISFKDKTKNIIFLQNGDYKRMKFLEFVNIQGKNKISLSQNKKCYIIDSKSFRPNFNSLNHC